VKRDRYRCVQCYAKGIVVTERLEVDHIQTIEDRPDLALDIDNLRTLCRHCHDKRHNRLPSSAKWADERYEW
ncbi:TPA: HNH endonuclease signature motif containing protein, partial [Streptococcus suis]